MFSGKHNLKKAEQSENVFLDKNPKIFDLILNYLRYDGKYQPKNMDAETKNLFEKEILFWKLET